MTTCPHHRVVQQQLTLEGDTHQVCADCGKRVYSERLPEKQQLVPVRVLLEEDREEQKKCASSIAERG